MTLDTHTTGLQLRSLVSTGGNLELTLRSVPNPTPGPGEVLVRIEAAPINPSDIGLLFGPADLSTVKTVGSGSATVVTARIPETAMPSMKARLGESMPVGNEGAGTVVSAGSSGPAQALVGAKVAVLGGGMYAQYRCVPAHDCLVLPADATAADGASSFVNPLTALGMVETMRREGHTALVHTAAASNLGQMLNRICTKDGIDLVNIVRNQEQVGLLRAMGAVHVCDSTSPSFLEDLTTALKLTGATLAFDATGGGRLAGQILACMEAAINATAKEYSRYGSTVHKQVYLYGGLDPSPLEVRRNFGMAWGMGGWLLFQFLQKLGTERVNELKRRVADELKTTFASKYTREISLVEALQEQVIAQYVKRATGTKFLLNPNKT